ncbi:MAG TPA: hypothetical protein ENN09_02935 [Planctomycetes bacterium]|nr:hypothetical protein [Planctomycetota bacterium]
MAKIRYPRVTSGMFSDADMFPEFSRFRKNPAAVLQRPAAKKYAGKLKRLLPAVHPMPQTPYSLYRQFARTGNRTKYQIPYFEKRRNLVAAAMAYIIRPSAEILDALQDYLWSTCEETTWILPAHERGGIDLFASETAFTLAEAVHVLRGVLAGEIIERIEHEVKTRVLEPYLVNVGRYQKHRGRTTPENLTDIYLNPNNYPGWFKMYHNNWNGVCNSSIGAALLYLENNPRRLADGINEVIKSLEYFIETAFEDDGASTEGAGYWQYGLLNFIPFSEMLRLRTKNRVDLLSEPKLRLIAEYPLKVHLGNRRFFNHADCPAALSFSPGVFARLAERTGVRQLLGLTGRPEISYRLPIAIRDLLWSGTACPAPRPASSLLPTAGIFRIRRGPVVIAGKAGHNNECHNHNDVGSFVVHSHGETFLCDPGPPTYCREFFSPLRYKLFVQANSRGHSVPVAAGRLQEAGAQYRGSITAFDGKSAEMELAGVYPVKRLKTLKRRIAAAPDGFTIEDTFVFNGGGGAEEAFVTWMPVKLRNRTALIRGSGKTLKLEIVEPRRARFALEEIPLDTKREGAKTLRRITVKLPPAKTIRFRMTGGFAPCPAEA